MRKALEFAALVIGMVLLVVAFGIGWAQWGAYSDRSTVMMALVAAVLVAIAILALIAGLSKGKDRSLAMLFAGVLLAGLSVLFFDIGLFFLPLAVILIVFSLIQMKKQPA